MMGALLFGVHMRAPDFLETPISQITVAVLVVEMLSAGTYNREHLHASGPKDVQIQA